MLLFASARMVIRLIDFYLFIVRLCVCVNICERKVRPACVMKRIFHSAVNWVTCRVREGTPSSYLYVIVLAAFGSSI